MSEASIDVSVIIPAYNRAQVIERAIDSALGQTLNSLEVIVVDDASTDTTGEIVKRYSDPRVRYLKHTENLYAAAARNTGMGAARGRYIAFLDSDDEWLPQKLAIQVARLDQCDDQWGCLYAGAWLYKDGSEEPVAARPDREGDLLRAYLTSEVVIWTPTFVFRRACLARIGEMDTALKRGQDRDFYIRLLRHYKIACVTEPVANIYLETTKAIADVSLESRRRLLTKHDDLLRQCGGVTRRRAYAIQWMLQAEQFLVENRTREGLRYAFKSMSQYPLLPPRRYAAVLVKVLRSLNQRSAA